MFTKDLIAIMIISMICCPVLVPIFAVVEILDRRYEIKKNLLYLIAGSVSLIIGFLAGSQVTLLKYASWLVSNFSIDIRFLLTCPYGITDYLLSDFFTLGVGLLLFSLVFTLKKYDASDRAIRQEKLKEQDNLKFRKFPWDEQVNSLTLATTGGGKTVRLLKHVEAVLKTDKKKHDFVCIVDGKGAGPTDEYGIFNTVRFLTKKYHQPFVVVNATTNETLPAKQAAYNPFYGLSIEEVKEMVSILLFEPGITKTAGSDHYKSIFESYLLAVLTLMFEVGEHISLPNITKLLDKDNLTSWMQDNADKIKPEQRAEMMKQITGSWNDVRSTVIKLQGFMKGIGGRIFSSKRGGLQFNVRTAYERNFVTLFLISELAAPEFAAGIGRVIILDIRTLINNRINGNTEKDKQCRFFLDEFSAFSTEAVLSILSRARSSGSSLHLFTQSLFDLEKISKDFLNAVLDNTTVYHIGRQNSPDSAEKCAAIIGTEHDAKLTSVAMEGYASGLGTYRTTRSYRIHPDTIKTMRNNVFIRYDKVEPEKLAFVRNEFVDMEG